jgi:hypothetical protein
MIVIHVFFRALLDLNKSSENGNGMSCITPSRELRNRTASPEALLSLPLRRQKCIKNEFTE